MNKKISAFIFIITLVNVSVLLMASQNISAMGPRDELQKPKADNIVTGRVISPTKYLYSNSDSIRSYRYNITVTSVEKGNGINIGSVIELDRKYRNFSGMNNYNGTFTEDEFIRYSPKVGDTVTIYIKDQKQALDTGDEIISISLTNSSNPVFIFIKSILGIITSSTILLFIATSIFIVLKRKSGNKKLVKKVSK